MAVTKKKAKTKAKREFAYENSYGDLSGPMTKKDLIGYLTEDTLANSFAKLTVYRLEKIKFKITPAKIEIA